MHPEVFSSYLQARIEYLDGDLRFYVENYRLSVVLEKTTTQYSPTMQHVGDITKNCIYSRYLMEPTGFPLQSMTFSIR